MRGFRRILHCIGIDKQCRRITDRYEMKKWDKALAESYCKDMLKRLDLNSVTAFYVFYFPIGRLGISDVNKRLYVNAADMVVTTDKGNGV